MYLMPHRMHVHALITHFVCGTHGCWRQPTIHLFWSGRHEFRPPRHKLITAQRPAACLPSCIMHATHSS